MKPIFVDTVYLMALVNPRDQHHARAIAFDAKERKLTTTRFVLIEVADGFGKPNDRQRAIDLIDAMENNPQAKILPAEEQLYRAGYELYCGRMDKSWSLTDCISFALMRREGLHEALTADHHFVQAGFVALMKDVERA